MLYTFVCCRVQTIPYEKGAWISAIAGVGAAAIVSAIMLPFLFKKMRQFEEETKNPKNVEDGMDEKDEHGFAKSGNELDSFQKGVSGCQVVATHRICTLNGTDGGARGGPQVHLALVGSTMPGIPPKRLYSPHEH